MMKIKALVMGVIVMTGATTATVPTTAQIQVPTVSKVHAQEVVKEEVKEEEVKVYVTKTGSKFHKANCKSLSKSKIEKDFKEVMLSNYKPCNNCHTDVECRQLKEEQKKLKEEQKKTLTIASKPSN